MHRQTPSQSIVMMKTGCFGHINYLDLPHTCNLSLAPLSVNVNCLHNIKWNNLFLKQTKDEAKLSKMMLVLNFRYKDLHCLNLPPRPPSLECRCDFLSHRHSSELKNPSAIIRNHRWTLMIKVHQSQKAAQLWIP